jgi:hypothetical protein
VDPDGFNTDLYLSNADLDPQLTFLFYN